MSGWASPGRTDCRILNSRRNDVDQAIDCLDDDERSVGSRSSNRRRALHSSFSTASKAPAVVMNDSADPRFRGHPGGTARGILAGWTLGSAAEHLLPA